MSNGHRTRRRFLQASGAAALGVIAGCTGRSDTSDQQTTTSRTSVDEATSANSTTNETTAETSDQELGELAGPRHGDDLPTDDTPRDGYPPKFDTVPEKRSIDTSTFTTVERNGVEVPLVPIDIAYYWYARGEARLADARSEAEFDVSHIFGAVLSQAANGQDKNDPVKQWPKDDRIITYCQCPHYLSSVRAASLIQQGYQNVYAIDEGFRAWREQNYPLAGSDTDRKVEVRTIEGNTDASQAGEAAWAFHKPSSQQEATQIREDGSYTLELRFVNVTSQSTITVETPAYTVTESLGTLTNGTIKKDGAVQNGTTVKNDLSWSLNRYI